MKLCNCHRPTSVKTTRHMPGGEVFRVRECVKCKTRWRTVESYVEWDRLREYHSEAKWADKECDEVH